MPQANKSSWRLSKTLQRDLDFRDIQLDDIKYAWAAYKKEGLVEFAVEFEDRSMTADKFKEAFQAELVNTYHEGWTLMAKTKKGFMPVGMILGFYTHEDPRYRPFMTIGCILWFPWASARNRIESAVHFFNTMRGDLRMVDYVRMQDKKFFETLAKHGVMRRVGTSYNVYPSQPALIFETRSNV